jgi:hypothetical protein
MAAAVSPGEKEQLHHFVATSRWDVAPLEEVSLDKADGLVGGAQAHSIIDDAHADCRELSDERSFGATPPGDATESARTQSVDGLSNRLSWFRRDAVFPRPTLRLSRKL